MGQLADQAIQLSRAYRETAGTLLDRARALRDAGELTPEQYAIVYSRYLQMVQSAVNILDEASHIEALGITREIEQVESATKSLKEASANIEKVREVIDVSASLVAAIGAVAVAIVDPTHVSVPAAAGALLAAAGTINKYAAGGG